MKVGWQHEPMSESERIVTANIDVNAIASHITSEAVKQGGETWTKIKKSAPQYFRGYANSLADIAGRVAKGDISVAEAKIYAQNAKIILVMSIANTSKVISTEVQAFLDNVVAILKTAINKALKVAIL